MYIPAAFREDNTANLLTLIRTYSFGTLVSVRNSQPFATHLPFIVDVAAPLRLRTHLARANPQWEPWATDAEPGEVMAIFQGPHAYISPAWYASPSPNVPTWNYAVVHAYGVPRLMTDDELRQTLTDLVAQYESGRDVPWTMEDPAMQEYTAKLQRGIVGVEITVTRLEGKYKLSQNKPEADRRGAITGLRETADPLALETAHWMEQYIL